MNEKKMHLVIQGAMESMSVNGKGYAHTLVMNPAWEEVLLANPTSITSTNPTAFNVMGATVRFDETEPNFRFEDIYEDHGVSG